MPVIPVAEAETRLGQLVHDAAHGDDVVITAGDGASVRLVPVPPAGAPLRSPGSAKGQIRIHDDFDAPLDDFAGYR